jgi:HSP20 family molecular chaperone IbpA
MARRNPGPWIWGETVDLLEQAERLQRQFFRLAGGAERAGWEPPVDVFADGDEILVEVALPGVPADRIELVCAPGELVVRGERRLPRRLASAAIQRLEIPHGRFERRLALPPGRWALVRQELADGCLQLLLARR